MRVTNKNMDGHCRASKLTMAMAGRQRRRAGPTRDDLLGDDRRPRDAQGRVEEMELRRPLASAGLGTDGSLPFFIHHVYMHGALREGMFQMPPIPIKCKHCNVLLFFKWYFLSAVAPSFSWATEYGHIT